MGNPSKWDICCDHQIIAIYTVEFSVPIFFFYLNQSQNENSGILTRYTRLIIPVHASARRKMIIICLTIIFRYISVYKLASTCFWKNVSTNARSIHYIVFFCYLHNHTVLSMHIVWYSKILFIYLISSIYAQMSKLFMIFFIR